MKKLQVLLSVLLLIAPPLMALTLDEARKQGRAGETLSGYIAPLKQDSETLELVSKINQGREQQYRALAEKNNMSTVEVARIAGQKLVERAALGEYVRGLNGKWLQKTP
ncbi:YdbL family protein [Erwinia mallotivora]|uniref:YdbL family protein n=1 Tax=Erwinia mallotivora TaxID=69222 RepID=UPI0021BFD997|nr:YdbL family protein [Erwinia mallotivora]